MSGAFPITDHLDALRGLCRRHRVARLDLFGSAASGGGAFDPARSDIDLLVEFLPMPPIEHKEAYFALLADLRALLGPRIDLVELDGVRNALIRRHIDATRSPLYAAA